MSEEKTFTNKQLKLIILDLYKSYNIELDEKLKVKLEQSSKTQYKYLIKIYDDVKQYIQNNISTSSNDTEKNDIELNKKEIECQTEIIIQTDCQNNELKTELFKMKQELQDYKFKIKNYKKIIKQLNNNKKIDYFTSPSITDEDENNDEKRKINYYQLAGLSSKNIINELKKLNHHQLKQLYNKYFSKKHMRQLEQTN